MDLHLAQKTKAERTGADVVVAWSKQNKLTWEPAKQWR